MSEEKKENQINPEDRVKEVLKEVAPLVTKFSPVENVIEIPLDLVDPPGILLREEVDEEEFEQLVDSIKKEGQRMPIFVKKKGDRFEIVDGHMRYLALKFLNIPTIKAIVREYTEYDAEREKLSANIKKVEQDYLGEARFYQTLMSKWGVNVPQLAEILEVSPQRIYSRLEILSFPEILQKAVQERKISISAAKWLNKIPREDVKIMVIDAAIRGGCTTEQAEVWYRRYQTIPVEAPAPTQEEIQKQAEEMEIYLYKPCDVCEGKIRRDDYDYIAGHTACINMLREVVRLERMKEAEEEQKKEEEKALEVKEEKSETLQEKTGDIRGTAIDNKS